MGNEVFDPVITVAGEPFEMGRQHGSLLRERVQRTVAGLQEQVGQEPYRASLDGLRETLAYCRTAAPELVAEMAGIAEGAVVAFDDVFRLNAHLDLMTWKRLVWASASGGEAEACSSHAVATPSAVLLGWNGDDWAGWLGCGAVVRGRPEGGEPFIYWSLAGSVGRPRNEPASGAGCELVAESALQGRRAALPNGLPQAAGLP